jgi:hypothetical protein
MEEIDYWRLSDELTVVQAALLTVGKDAGVAGAYVEGWDVEKRPVGYEAAKNAISRALLRGDIDGEVVPQIEYDINGNPVGRIAGSVDIAEATVQVDSLRRWLGLRGVKDGFFFPDGGAEPDYLDPKCPRYAPKLAAAVRAWEAMEDPGQSDGKTPKQALAKWLRENAASYGLTGDDGAPNETGIEEVAKVANWQPSGGAPKTPGQ